MKTPKRCALVLLSCLAGNGLAGDDVNRQADAWKNSQGWWSSSDDVPGFELGSAARQLPLVKVAGNKFVDERGAVVVFRGVNIADPDKLVAEGRLNRELFEVIKSWGANVVRIPVHPSAWQRRGKKGYLPILDQTVRWINELGMYAIVDWHSIGNLKSEQFQNSSYYTTKAETLDFFRMVSARYKGVNSVAMYEIFNEPTVFGGQLGVASWADWKVINEEAITIIQAHNAAAISLVAGFNWAYDLKPIATAPIERDNVAYVSHPYPMKVAAPFEENWERDWGFVANRYPVIATEIGYQLASDKGAHIPVIDDGSYGPRISNYLGSKGISWVAWVFDPDWAPQMIKDWSYEATLQGRHFRAVMLKEYTP
ncbi:glycoside hydrolase family 5 protein [Roseateles oligotrophus]|uniref:Glycoside hydrolase family 5 protein n=1 Tax=Roseateles oligotrophus TaxID=1769250 RepID=A0ABT2YK67_9BURK|nr:glycoside hydrolase family 5 protein [Roseateles oligotrophus]MCV2370460.1 glycoside hydrolase family 5 protein [Roseateles oligotrophus]